MLFNTKVGDTRGALKATLIPASGAALTDVKEVRFRMADTLFKNVINRVANDFTSLPEVVVIFTASEVAVAGNFLGEFVVEYNDDSIETFPKDDYIKIQILRNVG